MAMTRRPDTRFGVGGADFSEMGILGLPAQHYVNGVMPAYPCYEWGSPGWDSTKYNLFMFSTSDNWNSMLAWLQAGNWWCCLMAGNEPDKNNMNPQAYANWLIHSYLRLGSYGPFVAVMGSVSQSPDAWTLRPDNPPPAAP